MDELNRALQDSVEHSAQVIQSLIADAQSIADLATACHAVVDTLKRGGKLLTVGHGGSAADALHLSEELIGRFDRDRRPLPAICLVADPTALTCIANDYGFAQIFPRQVEALAQPGDLLVIFSTSGNGEGLTRSNAVAHQRGAKTLAILGKGGGALAGQTDHQIIVQSDDTARIQEAHTLILHLILETVERELAPASSEP